MDTHKEVTIEGGVYNEEVYKDCVGCSVKPKCYETYLIDLFHTYYENRIDIRSTQGKTC